uniref:Uncharacterized protein n=1 Tax=Arundo donax TaxID=35708 RepID=A0A0A8ZB82_ARUDO
MIQTTDSYIEKEPTCLLSTKLNVGKKILSLCVVPSSLQILFLYV